MARYIAGDIGGTNSRLYMKELRPDGTSVFVARKTYPSRKYSSLTDIIALFLKEAGGPKPLVCTCAVAGPVIQNRAHVTNLGWTLDGKVMGEQLGIKHVILINDFAGNGYGILALTEKDVLCLTDNKPIAGAPIACLGAGTGLGEVYLTAQNGYYEVYPSEGGHTDFPPTDDLQADLLKYFKKRLNLEHVSVERLVGGPGFEIIYEFLAKRYPTLVNPKVEKALRDHPERANQIITKFALERSDELSVRTQTIFCHIYGAEAGNLVLKTLCYGGLYIAGGVAKKMLADMKDPQKFMKTFLEKGRMRKITEKVPVYIIDHPQVGLLGSAVVCLRTLKNDGLNVTQLASIEENVPELKAKAKL